MTYLGSLSCFSVFWGICHVILDLDFGFQRRTQSSVSILASKRWSMKYKFHLLPFTFHNNRVWGRLLSLLCSSKKKELFYSQQGNAKCQGQMLKRGLTAMNWWSNLSCPSWTGRWKTRLHINKNDTIDSSPSADLNKLTWQLWNIRQALRGVNMQVLSLNVKTKSPTQLRKSACDDNFNNPWLLLK